jgi:hypothetical protein
MTQVDELLDCWVEPNTKRHRTAVNQVPIAAGPWIAVRPRATARIDQSLRLQPRQRTRVELTTLTLSNQRSVSDKTKPREIVDDRLLESRTAALAIVIFDPQQNAAADSAG